MTENEAIERLKCMRLFMEISDKQNENKFLEDDYIANKIAIQALEEIQQYRAIGTIDEFKDLKEKFERNIEFFNKINLEVKNKAIEEFVNTLIPRLTDAIYQKDVESMTNLINDVARELKAGGTICK